MSTDPFAPPFVLVEPGTMAPTWVRMGALLAITAELILPIGREGLVWLGTVTVEGTLWLGPVTVVAMIAAIAMMSSSSPRAARALLLLFGIAALVVVFGSQLGRIQARFVEPLTRLVILGVELSEAMLAAVALRLLERRWAAGIALASAVGTLLFSLSILSGALSGLVGIAATIGWVASRVGRYGALFRLAM